MLAAKKTTKRAPPARQPQPSLVVDQQPNPAYNTQNIALMVCMRVEPYHYRIIHAHDYTDCGIGDILDQKSLNELIANGVEVDIT